MDNAYRQAVVSWMEQVRDFAADQAWIVPTLGTIHSVGVAVRLLTNEQEAIIVTPPVYNRFEQAAARLGRQIVRCGLVQVKERYEMDFAAIEAAMARPDTRLFVLCNPHNPIGQIWKKDELARLADLAGQYGVAVFSDEIFAENSLAGIRSPSYLTIPGARHNCIVSTSLGKAFGTTGFNHANMLIPDESLRAAFVSRRDREHYGSMDPVAYESLMAAYSADGKAWLDASNIVIAENIQKVRSFFRKNLPDVPVYGGEGGYIIWLDWRSRFADEQSLMQFLWHQAYMHLDAGSNYGVPEGFARMSLACPARCVDQALVTLERALSSCN